MGLQASSPHQTTIHMEAEKRKISISTPTGAPGRVIQRLWRPSNSSSPTPSASESPYNEARLKSSLQSMARQVLLFAVAFLPLSIMRLGNDVEAVSAGVHTVWLLYISVAPYVELLSIIKVRSKGR